MGWIRELRDLISWIRSRKKKEERIAKRKVSSINPLDVYTAFELHPNQHKYRNYKVKWHCEFVKLESSLLYIQIQLKYKDVNIFSEVSLNDYPELKNAKEGDKYVLTGIIEKTGKSGIYLSKLIELEKDAFFVF